MASDPFKTPPRKFKLTEEERGAATPTQYSPAGALSFSRDPRQVAAQASAVEEQSNRILKKIQALDAEKAQLEGQIQTATAALEQVDPADQVAHMRASNKVDGLRFKLLDISQRRSANLEAYRRLQAEGQAIRMGGKKRRKTRRNHKRKTHRRSR